jgi:hypothetical protein
MIEARHSVTPFRRSRRSVRESPRRSFLKPRQREHPDALNAARQAGAALGLFARVVVIERGVAKHFEVSEKSLNITRGQDAIGVAVDGLNQHAL